MIGQYFAHGSRRVFIGQYFCLKETVAVAEEIELFVVLGTIVCTTPMPT